MKYKLKKHVTEEQLVERGFRKNRSKDFIKHTKRGVIIIYEISKEIDELVRDYSTYTGYKYSHEYRHHVKRHIKDLINDGLVEVSK